MTKKEVISYLRTVWFDTGYNVFLIFWLHNTINMFLCSWIYLVWFLHVRVIFTSHDHSHFVWCCVDDITHKMDIFFTDNTYEMQMCHKSHMGKQSSTHIFLKSFPNICIQKCRLSAWGLLWLYHLRSLCSYSTCLFEFVPKWSWSQSPRQRQRQRQRLPTSRIMSPALWLKHCG